MQSYKILKATLSTYQLTKLHKPRPIENFTPNIFRAFWIHSLLPWIHVLISFSLQSHLVITVNHLISTDIIPSTSSQVKIRLFLYIQFWIPHFRMLLSNAKQQTHALLGTYQPCVYIFKPVSVWTERGHSMNLNINKHNTLVWTEIKI